MGFASFGTPRRTNIRKKPSVVEKAVGGVGVSALYGTQTAAVDLGRTGLGALSLLNNAAEAVGVGGEAEWIKYQQEELRKKRKDMADTVEAYKQEKQFGQIAGFIQDVGQGFVESYLNPVERVTGNYIGKLNVALGLGKRGAFASTFIADQALGLYYGNTINQENYTVNDLVAEFTSSALFAGALTAGGYGIGLGWDAGRQKVANRLSEANQKTVRLSASEITERYKRTRDNFDKFKKKEEVIAGLNAGGIEVPEEVAKSIVTNSYDTSNLEKAKVWMDLDENKTDVDELFAIAQQQRDIDMSNNPKAKALAKLTNDVENLIKIKAPVKKIAEAQQRLFNFKNNNKSFMNEVAKNEIVNATFMDKLNSVNDKMAEELEGYDIVNYLTEINDMQYTELEENYETLFNWLDNRPTAYESETIRFEPTQEAFAEDAGFEDYLLQNESVNQSYKDLEDYSTNVDQVFDVKTEPVDVNYERYNFLVENGGSIDEIADAYRMLEDFDRPHQVDHYVDDPAINKDNYTFSEVLDDIMEYEAQELSRLEEMKQKQVEVQEKIIQERTYRSELDFAELDKDIEYWDKQIKKQEDFIKKVGKESAETIIDFKEKVLPFQNNKVLSKSSATARVEPYLPEGAEIYKRGNEEYIAAYNSGEKYLNTTLTGDGIVKENTPFADPSNITVEFIYVDKDGKFNKGTLYRDTFLPDESAFIEQKVEDFWDMIDKVEIPEDKLTKAQQDIDVTEAETQDVVTTKEGEEIVVEKPEPVKVSDRERLIISEYPDEISEEFSDNILYPTGRTNNDVNSAELNRIIEMEEKLADVTRNTYTLELTEDLDSWLYEAEKYIKNYEASDELKGKVDDLLKRREGYRAYKEELNSLTNSLSDVKKNIPKRSQYDIAVEKRFGLKEGRVVEGYYYPEGLDIYGREGGYEVKYINEKILNGSQEYNDSTKSAITAITNIMNNPKLAEEFGIDYNFFNINVGKKTTEFKIKFSEVGGQKVLDIDGGYVWIKDGRLEFHSSDVVSEWTEEMFFEMIPPQEGLNRITSPFDNLQFSDQKRVKNEYEYDDKKIKQFIKEIAMDNGEIPPKGYTKDKIAKDKRDKRMEFDTKGSEVILYAKELFGNSNQFRDVVISVSNLEKHLPRKDTSKGVQLLSDREMTTQQLFETLDTYDKLTRKLDDIKERLISSNTKDEKGKSALKQFLDCMWEV